jgi:hypothetical protein
MQNQINLSPLTQFTHVLRAAELSNQKEVKISIQQARLLNLALTEIQGKLVQDYETLFNSLKRSIDNGVVDIQLDGGDFSDEK